MSTITPQEDREEGADSARASQMLDIDLDDLVMM
jgi:hypothetical protein